MEQLTARNNDILLFSDCKDMRTQVVGCMGRECFFHVPLSIYAIIDEPFVDASMAILDDGFMGGRGLEVLKRLKSVNPSMPVVYLAREGSEELCLQVFRLGARDYFSIPFEMRDVTKSLLDIIDAVHKKRRSGPLPSLETGEFIEET